MSEEAPLPLPTSAIRYWRHLIPVTLYPSFAFLLLSRNQGGWARALVFAAFVFSSLYAMWPTLKGRAKGSFWFLACGLYGAGGFLGCGVMYVYWHLPVR